MVLLPIEKQIPYRSLSMKIPTVLLALTDIILSISRTLHGLELEILIFLTVYQNLCLEKLFPPPEWVFQQVMSFYLLLSEDMTLKRLRLVLVLTLLGLQAEIHLIREI
jgi:hypothetical protein